MPFPPFRRLAAPLALALLIGFGPLATAAFAGPTLDAMEKAGAVKIGLTGDYPPFSIKDPKTGQYSGLDVDLARSLAAALGLQLVIVDTSWSTLSDDLQAGRFDIGMGGISVTPAREAVGLFSEPMLSDGKVAITPCVNKDKFTSLDKIDRQGVRVIANPGGTNEKFDRDHLKHAEIVMHGDNTTIFDALAAGKADLMITDGVEAKLQAKLNPNLCAIHPDQPFTRVDKAYFMPKDRELKALVDEWLIRFKKIGALQRKIDKWVE